VRITKVGDTEFQHHGDYSGNVTIVVPSEGAHFALSHNDRTVQIDVPFEDLKALVFEWLDNEIVTVFEDGGMQKLTKMFASMFPRRDT
jgi:hypothetical protein